MKFKHCPDCGSRLLSRNLGDEIGVPWCQECARPWFPVFPVAIIALVHDDEGHVLLLRQNYISDKFHNLVSGYVIPGEDAESCARREIREETGLEVCDLELVMTHWFAKKEMLMIGFLARVGRHDFRLSEEVDSASWHNSDEILGLLSDNPGSTSRRLALRFLDRLRLSGLHN